MHKITPRKALFITLAAVLLTSIAGIEDANATTVTVYDNQGNKIIVDTDSLSQPTTYYYQNGSPWVVYPSVPVAVVVPVYGVGGVYGGARRVSRRTSRRTSRRR